MSSGRLLLLLCLALPSLTWADPSPKEILDAADRARGKVAGLVWTVNMASSEGEDTKAQVIEVKAKNEDVLVTFLDPPRVKGQKMLLQGRNMWFIKPGVSKPIPISPRQKLMGQAANGDIASTNYAGDYEGTIKGEETVEGEPCYLLDLVGKSKNLTYDRIVYWVSKARLVGVKADFYTVSGKKFKSASFEYKNAITRKGEKIPFVSRMTILDALRPADVTTLDFGSITVKELPDSTFNLNLLAK